MSIFEAIMLICFGMAWPFSIYKSWKTREVGSKSLVFLVALLVGYVAGILHKVFYLMDGVIVLYVLNGTMVSIDIALYLRNRMYQTRASFAAAERADREEVAG
tara:strand:- start:75 stop:383 length:309 start_codon:yes stop_codon:yes gene_type:complete